MSMLHYCWCGGSTDERYRGPATMGPNSACELFINNTVGNKGPALAIHYWFAGGGEEFQFAGALNQPGLIQMLHVKSVSDLLSDGKLSDKRHNGEKSIDYIIGQLLQKKMYSAAKDLMSMCILWKYGGLYMDTTTLLDEHDLSQALLTTPDHAMFMQVPGGDRTATFMSGTKGEKAKYAARDMNQNVVRAGKGDEFKKGVVRTHNVDVWGIAAPEGDPLIYKVIEGYISRCEYLFGMKKSSTPIESRWHELTDMRNGIVSRLIMDSVFNGMHSMWEGQSWFTSRRGSFDDFVRAHTFDVEKVKEEGHTKGKCAILGLSKFHGKADWRNAK